MGGTARRVFARLWAALWRWRDLTRGSRRPGELSGDGSAARARFWSEFREGQREAEARKARLRS